MISIKPGVKLTGLTPQMVFAFVIVSQVFYEFGLPCLLTSANDSKHGEGSLHHCKSGKYTDGFCRANDFRTKYPELDGRETVLRDTVRDRLGADFDVLIESVGTENEHLHVEYDPKGG